MKSSKERRTFIRKTDGNADGKTFSAGFRAYCEKGNETEDGERSAKRPSEENSVTLRQDKERKRKMPSKRKGDGRTIFENDDYLIVKRTKPWLTLDLFEKKTGKSLEVFGYKYEPCLCMSDEDGNETNWRYAYDMLETVSAMERGEPIGGRLNDPKPITPEKFCELTFGAHRGGLTGKMPKELDKEEVELCRNKRIERKRRRKDGKERPT